jgi:hypothetical protein
MTICSKNKKQQFDFFLVNEESISSTPQQPKKDRIRIPEEQERDRQKQKDQINWSMKKRDYTSFIRISCSQ